MVKVDPVTSFSGNADFDNGGANDGQLRYIGAEDRTLIVTATMTVSPDNANDTIVIGINTGVSVDASSKVIQRLGGVGLFDSVTSHFIVSVSQNDTLEVYVGNMTGTDDFTVHSLNISAIGML